jgi:hypothetical protein
MGKEFIMKRYVPGVQFWPATGYSLTHSYYLGYKKYKIKHT